MLEPHGLEVEVSAQKVRVEYDTVEGYIEMFESNFGPLVMARQVLGEDRWTELHQAYVQMVERENQAVDGSLLLEPDYVLTVARRPA